MKGTMAPSFRRPWTSGKTQRESSDASVSCHNLHLPCPTTPFKAMAPLHISTPLLYPFVASPVSPQNHTTPPLPNSPLPSNSFTLSLILSTIAFPYSGPGGGVALLVSGLNQGTSLAPCTFAASLSSAMPRSSNAAPRMTAMGGLA